MNTSRPQRSVPRRSKRAGSASVTPASSWRRACSACQRRSSSACCTRLFTPSVSQEAAGCRAHRHAVGHGQTDHVGQVVLALGVVVVDAGQPVLEPGGRRGQDACVDFLDGALGLGGVLVLDDAADLAGGVAHDAAVAGGIVQHLGEHGGAIAARGQQAAQRVGCTSGTSPYSTSVTSSLPSPSSSSGTACCTAWPVPCCGCCNAKCRPSWPPNACLTRSAPWPTTTVMRAGASSRALASTCANMGLPASVCSTLGRSDCMRLPSPAARITTLSIEVYCVENATAPRSRCALRLKSWGRR